MLRDEQLSPRALIVNRTWPPDVASELAAIEVPAGLDALVGYVRAELDAQAAVFAAASILSTAVVTLASNPALDRARRPALVELGTALVLGLEAAPRSSSRSP